MTPTTQEYRRNDMTLLLLEKHERTMQTLEACLERMGYRVLTSASAGSIQETLENDDIDLLIASISEDEEGEHLEFLETILGNLPLILIQTEDDPAKGDTQALQGCSSVHLLKRPFTLDQLDQRIHEASRPRAL